MRVLSSATLIVELQRILPLFLFLFDLMYCKRSVVVLFSRLSVIHRTHKLHGIRWQRKTSNRKKKNVPNSRGRKVHKVIEPKFYPLFSLWRRRQKFFKQILEIQLKAVVNWFYSAYRPGETDAIDTLQSQGFPTSAGTFESKIFRNPFVGIADRGTLASRAIHGFPELK